MCGGFVGGVCWGFGGGVVGWVVCFGIGVMWR